MRSNKEQAAWYFEEAVKAFREAYKQIEIGMDNMNKANEIVKEMRHVSL
jgi:hypothetical protein